MLDFGPTAFQRPGTASPVLCPVTATSLSSRARGGQHNHPARRTPGSGAGPRAVTGETARRVRAAKLPSKPTAAERRAWISVSAVKCAIACAHISRFGWLVSRFGWHGRRASQAEGSVRSAALNVGRKLGRSRAGSRPLAQLPPRDAAWALLSRRLRLALGWRGRGVARTRRASAAVSGYYAQVSGVRAWAARVIIELEESAGWTTVAIGRVLIEEPARTIAAATGA